MRFRGDIEGLRAIAVALVIASHFGWNAMGGGFVGVDIFFVISGFLITSLLLAEHDQRLKSAAASSGFSLLGFYVRRVKRIIPAAVLVIVVTCLAANALWNELRAQQVRSDAWWALLSAMNFREIWLSTDYFGSSIPHSPLQHYWSLAVEEQFYFVWPLVLLIGLRFRYGQSSRWPERTLIVLSGVWGLSFAFSVTFTATNPAAAYFHPFTRAWELATGAVLATGLRLRQVPWASTTSKVRIVVFFLGLAGIFVTPAPNFLAHWRCYLC